MKIFMLIFWLVSFLSNECSSQRLDRLANNAISVEIGKNGLIWNLAFDHKFNDKKFGFRFSTGSNFLRYLNAFNAGGGIYFLAGSRKNYLELGVNFEYLKIDQISDDQVDFLSLFLDPRYPVKGLYTSVNIGFRSYFTIGVLRIGVSPGFIKNDFIQGAYIGYGFQL